MIKFNCTFCGKHLEVNDGHAGRPARCPGCKSTITIPILSQETGSTSSQQDKTCPYCGETIKAAAILCHFCGMNLQTGWPVHSETQQQQRREVPQKVTYHPQHDAFHGTLPLMVRLAVKAVHDVGFRLENASDSAGIVTFRTGVTWGSWSGVAGSIAIEDAGDDWFRVTGIGKQNLQGGQCISIDLLGEAKSKAAKVIAQMRVLAR